MTDSPAISNKAVGWLNPTGLTELYLGDFSLKQQSLQKARAAAMIFDMLDEDEANEVLRHLDPSEIERMNQETSTDEPLGSDASAKCGELERLLDANGFPEAPVAGIPQQHIPVEQALTRDEVEENLHLVRAMHIPPSLCMNSGKPAVGGAYEAAERLDSRPPQCESTTRS